MHLPEPHPAPRVHRPVPITTPHETVAPIPVQPGPVPAVQTVRLPDGRVVAGYALTPAPVPAAVDPRPVVSRTAVNIALGGIGFGAMCGGLILLTSFIAALAALITQLIILAAVLFGGFIAVQIFGATGHRGGGTTVNIRKAVIKRNHFHG
ncbi:hypothetical protein [Streptomyces abikoensis]